VHNSRKSPLTSRLLDATAYEIDHLNAALLVWKEVANRWQSCAEARREALDATELERGRLNAQVRMLRYALLASGIVSAVMAALAVVGWVR
jgi:ABC-type protease/lipase transport system fused ATPase/permease subunit